MGAIRRAMRATTRVEKLHVKMQSDILVLMCVLYLMYFLLA